MKVQLGASGVLATVAVLVGGLVAWKVYKTGGNLLAGAKQAAEQLAADAQSTWKNNVATPFARGQAYAKGEPDPLPVSSKAWLYGDYAYTGEQAGAVITDGEWYGDAVARRYEAEQRAAGAMPSSATITPNGAVFGIYPKP